MNLQEITRAIHRIYRAMAKKGLYIEPPSGCLHQKLMLSRRLVKLMDTMVSRNNRVIRILVTFFARGRRAVLGRILSVHEVWGWWGLANSQSIQDIWKQQLSISGEFLSDLEKSGQDQELWMKQHLLKKPNRLHYSARINVITHLFFPLTTCECTK